MQLLRAWIGKGVGRLRRSPRFAIAVAAVLLAALSLNAARIVETEKSGGLFGRGSRSDFDDYYQAARGLSAGRDVYYVTTLDELRKKYSPEDLRRPEVFLEIAVRMRGVGSYLYPPFLAFLLGPLARLKYPAAAAVFQLFSMLALFGYFVWMSGRGLVERKESPALFVLAAFLCFEFLRGNAANGNIGSFLILLIAAGLVLSFRPRGGWAFLGGALIGIAAVLKVTPVFLGFVLLGGRRFSALFGAVVAGIAGLLIPAVGLGFEANLTHLTHWYTFIIKNFAQAVFVRPWANNQTISAALAKLLLPNADVDQAIAGLPLFGGLPTATAPFVASLARLLNLTFYALSAAAGLWVAYGKGGQARPDESPERGGRLLDLTTGVILVSLVGSGVSWYHAYRLLLVPVVWRVAAAFRGDRPGSTDVFLWSVLAFFSGVESLLPGEVRAIVALYSVFTFLMAAAAVLYLARAFRTSAELTATPPAALGRSVP